MKKIVALSAVALLLQGCTYAISPEMSARVDKTISFEMIQADPDTFKGKLVLLGGTISPRYLDAMIFAPGRELTVAAEVAGTRNKALDEMDYSYPVVIARELKLWERERQSWDKPQWIDPLNDPYYPARQDW